MRGKGTNLDLGTATSGVSSGPWGVSARVLRMRHLCLVDQDKRAPETEPDSRVLRASRWRLWLYFVGSFLFSAGGVGMIVDGDRTGWLVLVFFGGLAVLMLWAIWRPPRLELGGRTMTHTVRGRPRTYDLRRCGPFHVRDIPAGQWPFRYTRHRVTFSYDDPSDGVVRRALERLDEASGSENHFFPPSLFGMRADDFADLLNGYRTRALSSDGQPPGPA